MIEPADLTSAFRSLVPEASFLVDGTWIYMRNASYRHGYAQVRGDVFHPNGECFLSAMQISAFIIHDQKT
jgi:hypothetical protein